MTTSGKIVGFSKENSVQTEPQQDEIEDLSKQRLSLLNELQSVKDS